MLEGFRFIWKQKIILGAISLDLFAVLMGDVIAPANLPEDIHCISVEGLGWLRAAPGIGAIAVAAVCMFPIKDHAGKIMFVCVAIYGACTVLFGFSTIAWLSIGALILLGAADMVSVVVRETLLQLWTPDEVRGRVNAVNSGLRLGLQRAWRIPRRHDGACDRACRAGHALAVVIGGFGAIAVAGVWAWMFPQLREARRLDGKDVGHPT